jgi:hypothetical protein
MSFKDKNALAAHRATHSGAKKSKRNRRTQRSNNFNTLVLSLKEYWGNAPRNMSTIDLKPAASGLTKLAALALSYETYKVQKFSVSFHHVAGNNASGSYFAGVSYKAGQHPTDLKGVASLSPVIEKSINQDGSISVPCARAMGQPWLDTNADSPGAVMVWNDSSVGLHVWVSYTVVFNGPTTPSSSNDTFYTYNNTSKKWADENGQPVEEITLPFDYYGELEMQVSAQSSIQNYWNVFSSGVQTMRNLHQAFSQTIGVVHFIGSYLASFVLPAMSVPAILHIQQRPFRASAQLWRQLGGGALESGSCTSDEYYLISTESIRTCTDYDQRE